jgi:hypothetical protein
LTIEPAVVIGAIAAMGGLLLLVIRQFMSGTILSRTVVPREDYEAVLAINASYAEKFGEQTAAVGALTIVVNTALTRLAARK